MLFCGLCLTDISLVWGIPLELNELSLILLSDYHSGLL